jgi:hypothetical protein
VAYNKNLNISQNNIVNISGSLITVTGSLSGSQISGTTAQFTLVSGTTVSASTYVGLPEFSVTQQLVLRCINQSGASIAKGKVVHITSSQNNSDTPHIVLASWDSDLSSANTLGMTMETIANNATGSVILTGMLTQVPLIGTYTDGQMVYLSSSGDITPTKPTAPLHEVRIGQVTRTINSGNNTLFVRVQNGYEIDELHDVLVSGKQNGDLLVYNSGTGVWNNSQTLPGNYTINSASVTGNLFAAKLTASNAFFEGDIRVNGTASIAQLNTINQTSVNVGDKYIIILTGASDHASLDGSGIMWGSGSTGPTVNESGSDAHIRYRNATDQLEIFPGLTVSGANGLTVLGTVSSSLGFTGSLSGNATTATNALTASRTTGIVTFASSGGSAAGIGYNGSFNLTVSAVTVGAAATGSSNTFTGINTFNNTSVFNGTSSFNNNAIIDVSSSVAALRVTQRGGGESIRVEDDTNIDSTPFVVDALGNVGIGTPTPAGKLHVIGNTIASGSVTISGSLIATTKSFDIVHPLNPSMRLRYGSLEGPENGVYVRGKTKERVIKLPEYWTNLVDESTITVNLTPIGSQQQLWVEKVENNTVVIGGELVECYFTVFAERKDVDKLVVEY